MTMLDGNDAGLTEKVRYIADRNAERRERRFPMDFRSYDSMEGIAVIELSQPSRRFESWPQAKLIHAVYPGLLVAGTIALASSWLAQHHTAPVMLFALLFGMSFHFLYEGGGGASLASNSPRARCCASASACSACA
jgi:hypothetical protein